jgi:oligoendopeptidase F
MTVATAQDNRTSLAPSGWDLTELAHERTDEVLGDLLAGLEQAVARFERRRPSLDPAMSPGQLLEVLAEYEAFIERLTVLEAFATLWLAEDTQCPRALTFRSRLQQALADASNRTIFFELWWKGLGDAEAEALLPKDPWHADRAHFLSELRRFRPHTLDERSEQIITLKDANGREVLLTLYSVLTNRLEFHLEVDGRPALLTRDELTSLFHSPRRELRAAAYRELSRVYGREATALAQIYAARVRDWHQEHVGLRGYASPIAVRNLENDLPDAAVEALLDVIAEGTPIFQRYFRLKASWLGLPRLARHDLYAPLGETDRAVPYDEAVRLVLDTFEAFDARFAREARRVFEEGHVDSVARRGKRAGAFCVTAIPRQTPWVLLHYTDRPRDVATLAHELGHAVHSRLASGHSVLTQHASLPLAETASVFAEMLVTDRLLKGETDARVRRELLFAAVDNIYATVLRQASFVRFEIEAHRGILGGLSPEDLNSLYLENLAEQFGDSIEVPADFQHEWLSIPHLYSTPFYCYAYSFGQLLVLALYRRYQQQGDAFKPGYLKLLAYGGSARPLAILAEAGVDPRDPAFWRSGFEVIEDLVEELAASLPSPGA